MRRMPLAVAAVRPLVICEVVPRFSPRKTTLLSWAIAGLGWMNVELLKNGAVSPFLRRGQGVPPIGRLLVGRLYCCWRCPVT